MLTAHVSTTYRLRTLGAFELTADGLPIVLPRAEQRLVAYLAIRGPAPRTGVAGTLWGDLPEARALACLRTTIWRLQRRDIGLTTAGSDLIRLPADVLVDLHDLSGVAGAWRPRPSASLDLLPGWYDDWVVLERERIRLLLVHTMERSAAEALDGADVMPALEWALLAVRLCPLRESAHRLVVRAHLAAGNYADAKRHVDDTHRLIESELGVSPSPRLRELLAGRQI